MRYSRRPQVRRGHVLGVIQYNVNIDTIKIIITSTEENKSGLGAQFVILLVC